MDFYDKIIDLIGDENHVYIVSGVGQPVGEIEHYNYVYENYPKINFIGFKLSLSVSSPYLIWNTPYYIKDKPFELPLDINIYNKQIKNFRVIVQIINFDKVDKQYQKINFHSCVYHGNYDWYNIDDKSLGV